MWNNTCTMCHFTCDTWGWVHNFSNSMFLAIEVKVGRCLGDFEEKDELLSHWIKYEVVFKTALASQWSVNNLELKQDQETWLCLTHLDTFWVDFGPYWTNLDHSVFLDQFIWTRLFGSVSLDPSLWIGLFWTICFDPYIWILFLDPNICAHLFGPVWLDPSSWTCLFGPNFMEQSRWTCLYGPV